MQKQIVLDDRDLETADIIGSKRFNENKKHQKTMSWNLKKMHNASRDIQGAQGEIAFEKWCKENEIEYQADYENTQCRNAMEDEGDGRIFINRQAYSVEVKTTHVKDPHLIVPEYQMKNPKDIYVLIRKTAETKFKIMGFTVPEELEDYYDCDCIHTTNTCYRMHHLHLIQDWEDFISIFSDDDEE